MDVPCPECRSVFRVDPAKVPASGVRARCSVCGAVMLVHDAERGAPVAPVEASVVPAAPDPLIAAEGRGQHTEPAEFATAEASASADVISSPAPHAMVAEVKGAPDLVTVASAPAVDQEPLVEMRTDAPAFGPRQQSAHERSSAPPSEPFRRTTPTPSTASPSAPTADPRPPQPRVAPRRVNPYLSNDPSQKARRLARALVSDLVAYNPQKREEGLRAGTLKDLFRDQIRKSWQEYVEQVGATTAESTPHFQDALNDILAGGRRVF